MRPTLHEAQIDFINFSPSWTTWTREAHELKYRTD